jgi:hypothetical protein
MPDEQSSSSVGARKRALGKILRDVSIKRRETYFDLLVSGYSAEQIASSTKKGPATVRRVVGQALAKRLLDAPEDYARVQIARLTKALRCADESLEEGDVRAIAPFLNVVGELSLYHGVNVGSRGSRPSHSRKLRPHRRRLRSRTPSASWLRGRTKTKKVAQNRTQAIEIIWSRNIVRERFTMLRVRLRTGDSKHPVGLVASPFGAAAPYWVRWPGAEAKLNSLARSAPMSASFASSMNRPGVAQACRSAPICGWKGSTWLRYQLLAGTLR